MNVPRSEVYACRAVREVLRLHADLWTDEFRQLSCRDQLDRQAERIVSAHQAGDRAVTIQISNWHPKWVGHMVEEIMACEFTLEDARETIAREYGFADWSDVETCGTEPPDPDFEAAVDTLLAGDVEALRGMLRRRPALVHERSRFGHRATLLHYVGSNGVETYRQVVPMNLAEVAQVLVDAGADVNAVAEMYGGGATTLGLLTSSSHPVEAQVVDEVVQVLSGPR